MISVVHGRSRHRYLCEFTGRGTVHVIDILAPGSLFQFEVAIDGVVVIKYRRLLACSHARRGVRVGIAGHRISERMNVATGWLDRPRIPSAVEALDCRLTIGTREFERATKKVGND